MYSNKRFFSTNEGAVLPLVAICIFMLFASIGIAVDMGRTALVKAKAQSALDSAVLAASAVAAQNNNAQMQVVAKQYFNRNLIPGYMGVTAKNLNVSYDKPTGATSGSVSINMPTIFGEFIGTKQVDLASTNEVIRVPSGLKLEVTFALDITGSMCNPESERDINCTDTTEIMVNNNQCVNKTNTKYYRMIEASKIFLTTLQKAATGLKSDGIETPDIFVNGSYFATYGFNSYSGMDPQNVSPFYPSEELKYYGYELPNHTVFATGLRNFDEGGSVDNHPLIKNLYASWPEVSCLDLTLTNNGTFAALSAVDPKWKEKFSHTNISSSGQSVSLPASFQDPDTIKVLVIMTDGQNNKYIPGVPEPEPAPEYDDMTKILCEKAKASGIVIFSGIQGIDPPKNAKDMMLACATKPENYFEAASGSELNAAFERIATSILTLRISK